MPTWHERFLEVILPAVQTHAQFAFRGWDADEREERIAEAVASAFESYRRLVQRGREHLAHPRTMATFAVLFVLNGRHVGGHASTCDVLSTAAQQKHGFRVERLPLSSRRSHETVYAARGQRSLDAFEERLSDNTQTPVPDQAAFRIDFPTWLSRLSQRAERIARLLAHGHSTQHVAVTTALSPGRISQMRRELRSAWYCFHGEYVA